MQLLFEGKVHTKKGDETLRKAEVPDLGINVEGENYDICIANVHNQIRERIKDRELGIYTIPLDETRFLVNADDSRYLYVLMLHKIAKEKGLNEKDIQKKFKIRGVGGNKKLAPFLDTTVNSDYLFYCMKRLEPDTHIVFKKEKEGGRIT